MNCDISIIIPVYNAEKFILKTLDSIKNQLIDRNKYEIILINDGSTDLSENLILTYIDLNKEINISYFYKKNGGLSNTRNFGIRKALGKYIWFFDADDLMEPGCLKKIFKTLDNELGIDFLGLGIRDIYENNNIYENNMLNKPIGIVVDNIEYLAKYSVEHSACVFLVKRKLLLEHSIYFIEGVLSEDYDFVLRLLFYCNKITHIGFVCYNYFVRTGSLSRRRDNNYYKFHHESMFKIISTFKLFLDNTSNEYKEAVEKYFEDIKIISLINLLKSTLSVKDKLYYYSKFADIGICDLRYRENLTFKQKIIYFLVKFRIYKIFLLRVNK